MNSPTADRPRRSPKISRSEFYCRIFTVVTISLMMLFFLFGILPVMIAISILILTDDPCDPNNQAPPDQWQARIHQAVALEADGRPAFALAVYDELFDVKCRLPDGNDLLVSDAKARCHFLLGDLDDAIAVLDQRADDFKHGPPPDYPHNLMRISQNARRFAWQHRWIEYEALADQIIQLNDGYLFTEAEDAVDSSRENIYGGSSEGFIRKYHALLEQDRPAEAQAVLDRYMQLYDQTMTRFLGESK